jgi:Fe-S oxidoreductase
MKRDEFTLNTKEQALDRQRNRCGSCGAAVSYLTPIEDAKNKYLEFARAHHMRHCQQGGTSDLSNCVILCQACHYSVHQGGNYRNQSSYLISVPTDYLYFNG